MIAILKKEVKGYLTSMVGYVFIAFMLVVSGIYFTAYHLNGAYPKFAYTLSAVLVVFLIAVPILTMRILAEERRQKTDQLLLTSPVSVPEIVIGKYLALVCIFFYRRACPGVLSAGAVAVQQHSLWGNVCGALWLLADGLQLSCDRTLHFLHHGEPGDRGGADVSGAVCLLPDGGHPSEEETEAEESSSGGETETAETRVAVFTSSSESQVNQMVSGGNYRLFVSTVSWLCGNETTVSIPVKNISTEYLTVPAASASFWSIVTIGIIPAGFLLTGLYTWMKRRRQ